MTDEKSKVNVLQIACLVGGFALVTTIARFGFGFSGIIPSAIAGAVGAVLGTIVYELIRSISRKP